MATALLPDWQLSIPPGDGSLAWFRRWAQSADFPDRGRIDFIQGQIEVDMVPEDFYCHGTLKTHLTGKLAQIIEDENLGDLVCDRSRVSSPNANFSAEPDLVFVSLAAYSEGRVVLVPKANREAGRFIEIEGAPDLIIEIVSDSSEAKDYERLPAAYGLAGVREYWLVDARGETLMFQIQELHGDRLEPVGITADGWQNSKVLQRDFRLERLPDNVRPWRFKLHVRKSEISPPIPRD